VKLIATGGTIATILDAKTAEWLVNIEQEPSVRELVADHIRSAMTPHSIQGDGCVN